MSVRTRRVGYTLVVIGLAAATTGRSAEGQGQGHFLGRPSAQAIADSQAVAAAHRSRTLAALFEEFRTTTPENARINSRAISNLFFDGNPLMRLVSSGDFTPIQASGNPITQFERDAIASFKAGGPGFFSRVDRVGPIWVACEAVALNNGALLAGSDMVPNVCQTCHKSFPADNTALVGSLNHCDIVRN